MAKFITVIALIDSGNGRKRRLLSINIDYIVGLSQLSTVESRPVFGDADHEPEETLCCITLAGDCEDVYACHDFVNVEDAIATVQGLSNTMPFTLVENR